MIASTMCTSVKTHTITNIVTRALHAQEGSFDIEVDMAYSNRMLYLLKKMHMLKGALTSKRRITPSKESFKVFEHVLTLGFDPAMSISKSVQQID